MASLGKEYKDGELIVRQGEMGNCMFVIQKGEVEAVAEADGRELRLRKMEVNDFFGMIGGRVLPARPLPRDASLPRLLMRNFAVNRTRAMRRSAKP